MRVMKNFSEEEEAKICAYLFTNPNGNNSFLYPQELVAGEEIAPLMSAVSRTHMKGQNRFLHFLDSEKPDMTRAMLPQIDFSLETFREPDGTLVISRRTKNFSNRWVLGHGHGSIKEETNLFGFSEEISDVAAYEFLAHPLNKPQARSTRYIDFDQALHLILEDPDLTSLPNAQRVLEYIERMNSKYKEMTARITDLVMEDKFTSRIAEYNSMPEVIDANIVKWTEEEFRINPDFSVTEGNIAKQRKKLEQSATIEGIRKGIKPFVLDHSRVYLTGGLRTGIGYSVDARTLENIITKLLSSPRIEDRDIGQKVWDEAKKITPVLLGERSHVKVDEWKVQLESEFREYVQEKFGYLSSESEDNFEVEVLSPTNIEMYTDRWNAANVIYGYVDTGIVDIMSALSNKDVKEILDKAHESRGKFDVLHPSISHGGLVTELTMGYHAHRDILRHRNGNRTTQLLTTRHGSEVPELFDVFGLTHEYLVDMDEAARIYEEVRQISPHVAEKVVPFGAKARSLVSWQMTQHGYVGALRTNLRTGNRSYVAVVREIARQLGEKMPLTARHLKTNTDDYPPELWTGGYDWYNAKVRH